jgi:hypothetical protein
LDRTFGFSFKFSNIFFHRAFGLISLSL